MQQLDGVEREPGKNDKFAYGCLAAGVPIIVAGIALWGIWGMKKSGIVLSVSAFFAFVSLVLHYYNKQRLAGGMLFASLLAGLITSVIFCIFLIGSLQEMARERGIRTFR